MLQTRGHFIFLTFLISFLKVDALCARSYIQVVGSSAIYPFAIAVAETFHQKTKFPTPIIESTGTGGGIKAFCTGIGVNTPDVVLASRAMSERERHYCLRQGVTDILEVTLGFDGIVIASPDLKAPFSLSREQLYLALAAKIDDQPNRSFYWSDVSSEFPRRKIRLLGPSSASGTREAFTQLIMQNPQTKLRHDGVYIEASDQETVIVQKLQLEPEAFGVFSFSFLMLNSDKVTPLPIEGVTPTFKTIVSGEYPLSRPFYLYVKSAHLDRVKGLAAFVEEFISADAVGHEGYLASYGFIPQPEQKRLLEEKQVHALTRRKKVSLPEQFQDVSKTNRDRHDVQNLPSLKGEEES